MNPNNDMAIDPDFGAQPPKVRNVSAALAANTNDEPMDTNSDSEEQQAQFSKPETDYEKLARLYQKERASATVQSKEKESTVLAENKLEILKVIDARGGQATLSDVLVDKPITHLGRYFLASLELVKERLIKMRTITGVTENPVQPAAVILTRLPPLWKTKSVDNLSDFRQMDDDDDDATSVLNNTL